ncbi:poly(ethylene terephthalate) hydrolase family protein [Actinomadura fibrosa]|uniref:poly(ethylene terephthalate) hydrolase n=1 Tax=Actinomadura fibrosa TaxID=111802 RepID=A0ABW2Y2H3_9ACTN|nr:acetylxylan esterase [Actinomadura fibrosa]
MSLRPARWLALVCSAVLLAWTSPALATAPAATDWSAPGPDEVAFEVLAEHTLFYPKDLGQARHPVILWGNGTFAIPAVYLGLLRHLASHGFIVAAANTPMSGSGKEMRAGLDLLAARDADPASPFHGRVDLAHVGATGHSQGGAGTVRAAADPRVTALAPIEPAGADTASLRQPALFLAGQNDHLVAPAEVKAMYDEADQVPAVYAEVAGAGHISALLDGQGFRGPVTAWMRAFLADDREARAMFFGPGCGYCADPAFSRFLRNPLAGG